MNLTKTSIPDIILIKPVLNYDNRGYFFETFREKILINYLGYNVSFCQENETRSEKGVLRGLHFQLPPFSQSKLVRVIEGEVLDIAVDIRYGSPTYGQHIKIFLSGKNKHSLFIPRGFAHGFIVLSDWALFSYKVDNYYSPKHEFGLAYNDPSLGIDWYLPENKIRLSHRDKDYPFLEDIKSKCIQFSYKNNLYD